MASLYKNNGIWYIAVSHNGTRKCRSLKTKDIKVAKSIKSYVETIILQELGGFIKSNAKLSFSDIFSTEDAMSFIENTKVLKYLDFLVSSFQSFEISKWYLWCPSFPRFPDSQISRFPHLPDSESFPDFQTRSPATPDALSDQITT